MRVSSCVGHLALWVVESATSLIEILSNHNALKLYWPWPVIERVIAMSFGTHSWSCRNSWYLNRLLARTVLRVIKLDWTVNHLIVIDISMVALMIFTMVVPLPWATSVVMMMLATYSPMFEWLVRYRVLVSFVSWGSSYVRSLGLMISRGSHNFMMWACNHVEILWVLALDDISIHIVLFLALCLRFYS